MIKSNPSKSSNMLDTSKIDAYKSNCIIFDRWEYMSPSGNVVRLRDKQQMLADTKTYHEEFRVDDMPQFDKPTNIRIEEMDTLDAVHELMDKGMRPVIHSFANGYYPCGLYEEGDKYLEESLCRVSTLSVTLNQFKGKTNSVYPMDMNYGGIYSKVSVFRKGEEEGFELLEEPYDVDIISVAALNLRSNRIHKHIVRNLEYALHGEDPLTEEGKKIMFNKIRTIFRIAISNGHDSIVLGAWGCGVNKQRPKQLATMFKMVLDEIEFRRKFREVVFAIDGHKNYVHFVRGIEGNDRFKCKDRPAYFCFKVGEDRIWGAEYPGDIMEHVAKGKIQHALEFGITHFIDLTEEGELPPYKQYLPKDKNVHYIHFPIKDARAPESMYAVYNLLLQMDDILKCPASKIYLHCWGGVGRTGTIAACWLIMKYKTSYYKTISNLLEMWKTCLKSDNQPIPDHWTQKAFIKSFTYYIHKHEEHVLQFLESTY